MAALSLRAIKDADALTGAEHRCVRTSFRDRAPGLMSGPQSPARLIASAAYRVRIGISGGLGYSECAIPRTNEITRPQESAESSAMVATDWARGKGATSFWSKYRLCSAF